MSRVILSIDPGITGTGVAVWMPDEWGENSLPFDAFNIYPSGMLDSFPLWAGGLHSAYANDWQSKAEVICAKLANHLLKRKHSPMIVFCEFPEYMEGVRGHTAAVSGDLLKMTYLVGKLSEWARNEGSRFIPITPGEWKGNLSKGVVERRICRLMPEAGIQGYKSHTWDAIGIGLYAKGVSL